jgi:hypothetical protein
VGAPEPGGHGRRRVSNDPAGNDAVDLCGAALGDRVEVDGREHFRSGTIRSIGRYENATDTIFPCMVITDIQARPGDSGGAVLVSGLPAGTTSRDIGGRLAFTPLGEGLANLGLVLCTTPDCDLTPRAR